MKQCMKQWLLNSSVNGCCRLTVRSWDGMVLWTQIRARGRVRQTSTSYLSPNKYSENIFIFIWCFLRRCTTTVNSSA